MKCLEEKEENIEEKQEDVYKRKSKIQKEDVKMGEKLNDVDDYNDISINMLVFIILVTLILDVISFHLHMNTKSQITQYEYEIPKWAEQRFKKNKLPNFSEYNNKIKKPQPKNNYISEEEAQYNAIMVCKLPFGLIQKRT